MQGDNSYRAGYTTSRKPHARLQPRVAQMRNLRFTHPTRSTRTENMGGPKMGRLRGREGGKKGGRFGCTTVAPEHRWRFTNPRPHNNHRIPRFGAGAGSPKRVNPPFLSRSATTLRRGGGNPRGNGTVQTVFSASVSMARVRGHSTPRPPTLRESPPTCEAKFRHLHGTFLFHHIFSSTVFPRSFFRFKLLAELGKFHIFCSQIDI